MWLIHFITCMCFGLWKCTLISTNNTEILPTNSDEAQLKHLFELSAIFGGDQSKTEMTFTLFTREHRRGIQINESLVGYYRVFDEQKPTKFVIHGWNSNGNEQVCVSIKNGFLQKYDANVFIVDWGLMADTIIYFKSLYKLEKVAKHFTRFLMNVVSFGVKPANIHLVGHSLGAHLSGMAARNLQNYSKIGRITGLDPSEVLGQINGLQKTDADFVDVIHTCAGLFGEAQPAGHVDFYPNGGTYPQPGCADLDEWFSGCSHSRSWQYFAESLTSTTPFKAYKCESFVHFMIMKQYCKEPIFMGDSVSTHARGSYYLETNWQPPFAVSLQ